MRTTIERTYANNKCWRLVEGRVSFKVEVQTLSLMKGANKIETKTFFRKQDAVAYIYDQTTRKNRL